MKRKIRDLDSMMLLFPQKIGWDGKITPYAIYVPYTFVEGMFPYCGKTIELLEVGQSLRAHGFIWGEEMFAQDDDPKILTRVDAAFALMEGVPEQIVKACMIWRGI